MTAAKSRAQNAEVEQEQMGGGLTFQAWAENNMRAPFAGGLLIKKPATLVVLR